MKKNTKRWFLLKLEREIDSAVQVTVTPDRLLTASQAMQIINAFK